MKFAFRKVSRKDEFRCKITKFLDEARGINNKDVPCQYHHYVVADASYRKDKILAIRVPGSTVGFIKFDKNGVITEVSLFEESLGYPTDIEDNLKQFIGEQIEWYDEVYKEVIENDNR